MLYVKFMLLLYSRNTSSDNFDEYTRSDFSGRTRYAQGSFSGLVSRADSESARHVLTRTYLCEFEVTVAPVIIIIAGNKTFAFDAMSAQPVGPFLLLPRLRARKAQQVDECKDCIQSRHFAILGTNRD